jgi:N-acetyl-anhydromuramyl-L-alanine amidase AmpD
VINIDSCKNKSSRGNQKPEVFVLHLADGFYQGTIATCKNGKTSSTFVIGKNGEITYIVPIDYAPWTQGVLRNPTSKIVKSKGNINPNKYAVSVEFEGFWSNFKRSNGETIKGCKGKITQAQVDACVEALKFANREIRNKYGYEIPYDREHIIGHYEINPVTRPCCGKNFPYDEIIQKLNGDKSKPTISPIKPILENKFKKGDYVILNGKLFSSSNGNTNGIRDFHSYKTKIISVVKNVKNPYLIDGKLGWANDSLLKAEGVVIGSKVKITGDKYSTGQQIPSWVKNTIHEVKSISNDKALIKNINSWVYLKDLIVQ